MGCLALSAVDNQFQPELCLFYQSRLVLYGHRN
jgi:hypothetical protein